MDTDTNVEAMRLHYFHCTGCQECAHEYDPGGYFNSDAPDDCLICGRECGPRE